MVSYNGEWNLLSKLSWYPDITPNWTGVFLSKISRNPNSGSVSHALMQIGMWKTDVPPPGVYSVYITHESLIMMTIMIIIITMLVTMMMIYDLHRWYKTRNEHTKYKKFNGNVDIFIALCLSSQSMDILNEKTFPFWKLLSQ